jgi:hypothetical protein
MIRHIVDFALDNPLLIAAKAGCSRPMAWTVAFALLGASTFR